jgi:hypothetical protein
MFAELLLLFPSVSFAPHFRQKKNCLRWASLLLWNFFLLPNIIPIHEQGGGVGILDVSKYVRAYPPSSHQFLLLLLFMSNSQLCSHQVPNVFTFTHMTFVQRLNSHIIYMCVCVCVCVCEPKEALLLIYILSTNFYFGECPKFQDFLLWWANQNGSLGTFFFFFFFKFKKRGKFTKNFGMHLTTIQ